MAEKLVTAPENHVWRALFRAKLQANEGIKRAQAALIDNQLILDIVTSHAQSRGWTLD